MQICKEIFLRGVGVPLRWLTLSGVIIFYVLNGPSGGQKVSIKKISGENKGASFSGHMLNQKKNWLSLKGRGGGGVCMQKGKFPNFFSDFI